MLLELESHSATGKKSPSKTYKTTRSSAQLPKNPSQSLVPLGPSSSSSSSSSSDFCSLTLTSKKKKNNNNKLQYPLSPLLIKDPLLMYGSTMVPGGSSSPGFKTFSLTEPTFPKLVSKYNSHNRPLNRQYSAKYVDFPPVKIGLHSKTHYPRVHGTVGDTIVGPSTQRVKALAAYHAQLNKGTFFNNRALVDFSKIPAWFTARDIYFNASNLSKRKKKMARIKVQGMRQMTEINAALIEAKEMEVEVETNEFDYHSEEDEDEDEDEENEDDYDNEEEKKEKEKELSNKDNEMIVEEENKLIKTASLVQKKTRDSETTFLREYKVMMIAVPKANQLPSTLKNEVSEEVSMRKSEDTMHRDKRRNSSFSRAFLGLTKPGVTKKRNGGVKNGGEIQYEGEVYEVQVESDYKKKKGGVTAVVTEIGDDESCVQQEKKRKRIRFSDQVEYSWFEYLAAEDVAEVRSSMLHNGEMPTTPFAMASLTRPRGSFSWTLKGMMMSHSTSLLSGGIGNGTILSETTEGSGEEVKQPAELAPVLTSSAPQEMYKLRPASKSITSLVSLSNLPLEEAVNALNYHENAPSSLPVTRFLYPVSSAGLLTSVNSRGEKQVYSHSSPRGLVRRDTASLHAVTRMLSKSLGRSGQWSSGGNEVGSSGTVSGSAMRFRKEVIRKKTHHFYIARVFRTNFGDEDGGRVTTEEEEEEEDELMVKGLQNKAEGSIRGIMKVRRVPVVAEHGGLGDKKANQQEEAVADGAGSDYPESIYRYYLETDGERTGRDSDDKDEEEDQPIDGLHCHQQPHRHRGLRPWRVGNGTVSVSSASFSPSKKVWWQSFCDSGNDGNDGDDGVSGFSFVKPLSSSIQTKESKKKNYYFGKKGDRINLEGYLNNCYCDKCNEAYLQNHVEPYAEPVQIGPCRKYRITASNIVGRSSSKSISTGLNSNSNSNSNDSLSASALGPPKTVLAPQQQVPGRSPSPLSLSTGTVSNGNGNGSGSGGGSGGMSRGLVAGSGKSEWEGKYLETNAPRMLEFMYYNWVFFGQKPPEEPQFL
ncbi:uncharacterized protein SAPINGB_P002312 [Magnusiomyces paraingens]|uniref:Uncharacterized protein n=1 Tax=Magnusiomyces paraingens TaxID=2606893 RepID=A0A5E8BD97_9ASCO|nr:uncharacterized protein SAPINGB_P002312 [Saprochaete ingens]VVT49525.1 unnamed protein product [Saprochaete ingens]